MSTINPNRISGSVPQVWEKEVFEPGEFGIDAYTTARDIGYIRKNVSRLSIISALSSSENDSVDWYKFNVQTKGKMSLSIRSDAESGVELDPESDDYLEQVIDMFASKGMRIEIMKMERNKMVAYASNDDTNEKAYERFKQLIRGDEQINQLGTYYLKVSTVDGKPPKEDINYIMQLQMGDTYKHDYATVEKNEKLTEAERAQKRLEQVHSPFSPEVQGLLDTATANSLIMASQSASIMLESGNAAFNTILKNNALTASGRSTIFNFTS